MSGLKNIIDGAEWRSAAFSILRQIEPSLTRDQRLEVLMFLAQYLPHDREAQSLSFAFGNLAASMNHKPDREAFRKLARERYGWDDERFDAWAVGRAWRE